MPTFALTNFPNVCRMCLQNKPPEEMLHLSEYRQTLDASLSDLVEELSCKVPSRILPYMPKEMCHPCLTVLEFFHHYKRKITRVHKFMQALVAVKLGDQSPLLELFQEQPERMKVLLKDLDLCRKETPLAADILQEYGQYRIASMPMMKEELATSLKYEPLFEILDQSCSIDAYIPNHDLYDDNVIEPPATVDEAEEECTQNLSPKIEPIEMADDTNDVNFDVSEEYQLEGDLQDEEENVTYYSSGDDEEEEQHLEMPAADNGSLVQTSEENNRTEKPFSCDKCKFKSYYPLAWKAHQQRHNLHDIPGGHQCVHPSCMRSFQTMNQLKRHKAETQHHFCCKICGAILKHKVSMDVHLQRHMGVTSHNCDYCSSSFHTRTELRNHVSCVHITDEKFDCTICGILFKSNKLLKQHFESHVDTRNFICPDCDFAFKTQHHLSRHVLTVHTAVRFPCEYCPSTYGRRDKLRRHVEKAHNIQMYFGCKICLKKFNTSERLADHEYNHRHPKELECGVCLNAFLTKQQYEKHICITYRNDYVCCGRDFKYHLNFNRHMQMVHGIKMNARVKDALDIKPISKPKGRKNIPSQCKKCGEVLLSRGMYRKHACQVDKSYAVEVLYTALTNEPGAQHALDEDVYETMHGTIDELLE